MIVRTEPGEPDQVVRHRKAFKAEGNMGVHFQHWVSIENGAAPLVYRLGVDSRKIPYANVNDRIEVVFFPDDPEEIAFAPGHARTWGIGVLYSAIGLTFLVAGIPMLWAVGKPIVIDPEAPPESQSTEPETE